MRPLQLLVPLLLLSAVPLPAESQQEPQKTWRLELKSSEAVPSGKVAMMEGTASSAGDLFLVEDLMITQPVSVMLVTEKSEDDLQLRLAKFSLDEPDRVGSTGTARRVIERLRTEGDLKIQVRGNRPARYQLVVWAGEPIDVPMAPVAVSRAEYEQLHPGEARASAGFGGWTDGPPVLWVIAGLLFALVLIFGVRLLKAGT